MQVQRLSEYEMQKKPSVLLQPGHELCKYYARV